MQLVSGGEPEIAGARAEDVSDFAGYDGEKLFELESGGKGAAEIVKSGEALESGELGLAFAFDCAEIRVSLAGEAAGFLEKVSVFGGEFAGAFVEDFDDAFRTLRPGKRGKHRGFDAYATRFFEMFEIVVRKIAGGEAARRGRFEDDCEWPFADGIRSGNNPLARLRPASAAYQAFGSAIVNPHENSARAEGRTHAGSERFQ